MTADVHAPDIVSPPSKQEADTQPISVKPVNVHALNIVSPQSKQ